MHLTFFSEWSYEHLQYNSALQLKMAGAAVGRGRRCGFGFVGRKWRGKQMETPRVDVN